MAFVNEYTLNVDIKKSMSSIVPTFKQGDSARLKFKVFNNGRNYDLSSFVRAEITFKLPNNEVFIGNPLLQDGLIVYDFVGVEMERVGNVSVILSIYDSKDGVVSIRPFIISIYDSMKENNLSYIGVLQELIAETQDVVQYNAQRVHLKDWNANAQYEENNEVLFNGSTWRALRSNKGVTPTEGLDWTLIARKGADGDGNVIVHREVFTATEGQRVFNLQNRYDQMQNRTTVVVNGAPQFTPLNYQETTPTSITFYDGLPAGYIVEITYFSDAIPLADDVRTVVTNHTNQIVGLQNSKIEKITYQKFTSTANQTVFNLTTPYELGKGRLKVSIEGVPQYAPSNFTETNTTRFTLSEALPAGLEVVAEIYA